MNVELANPFVESIKSVLFDYVDLEAHRESLYLATGAYGKHLVTAIIRFTGHAKGVVSLSFPKDTAVKMAGEFADEEFETLSGEVADAIGEITNMVAGVAKTKLAQYDLSMTVPVLNVGKTQIAQYHGYPSRLGVDFQSEMGRFSLEIAMEQQPAVAR